MSTVPKIESVSNCKAGWPIPPEGDKIDCTGGPEMVLTPGGTIRKDPETGRVTCQTVNCNFHIPNRVEIT